VRSTSGIVVSSPSTSPGSNASGFSIPLRKRPRNGAPLTSRWYPPSFERVGFSFHGLAAAAPTPRRGVAGPDVDPLDDPVAVGPARRDVEARDEGLGDREVLSTVASRGRVG